MDLEVNFPLEYELKSNLFIFEEELIEIELIDDLEGFDILGIKFSGAKSKSKVNLPRYLANWLVFKNKAKFLKIETHSNLVNSLKHQTPSFRLNNIIENLLFEALNQIGVVSYSDEINSPLKSEVEIGKLRDTLTNLGIDRIKKILRDLVINDYRKQVKSLDNIEKPVIKSISDIIERYINFINLQSIFDK